MKSLLCLCGILLFCLPALAADAPKKDDKKKTGDEYIIMLHDEVPTAILALIDKAGNINAQYAAAEAASAKGDKNAEKKVTKLKDDRKKLGEDMKKQVTSTTTKAQGDADRLVKELDRVEAKLDKASEQESDAIQKQIHDVSTRLAAANEQRDAYSIFEDLCVGQLGQNNPYGLVGQSAPGISGPLFEPDGKAASLADVSGRFVILVFFASANKGSLGTFQDAVGVAHGYKETEVAAFGVDVDADREAAKADIVGKFKCPVIYDTNYASAKQYRVKFLPQAVLIGRDGSVLDLAIGHSNRIRGDFKRKIDDLLKPAKEVKPPAPVAPKK